MCIPLGSTVTLISLIFLQFGPLRTCAEPQAGVVYTRSFKSFPSWCSKRLWVYARPQKAPNLPFCFLKRRLTNTHRHHRLADGQLPSRNPPSPSFGLFGVVSVMLGCSPPASSSALLQPRVYYPISLKCKVLWSIVLLYKWTLNDPPFWHRLKSLKKTSMSRRLTQKSVGVHGHQLLADTIFPH